MDTTYNNNGSRDEIRNIFSNYHIIKSHSDITFDSDLLYVIDNIEQLHLPYERPDAYMITDKIVYGIEHFQISQYAQNKGDEGRKAEGSKNNRNKIKQDISYNLEPNINNLVKSLKIALAKHIKNADTYKDNLEKYINIDTKNRNDDEVVKREYRLILLIEDSSDQAAYIKKYDSTPRNPLLFDAIADEILLYKNEIWGVIYIGGNIKEKLMRGYTIAELNDKKNRGELLDIGNYRTIHSEDKRIISKNSISQDEHEVTIRVYDRI